MVAMGRVVGVQGGRVVRATGRRDRHSKVYTSRGPRDRRVRLAAVTAIQFYDLQDRLGYDRPSEAVDWLIQKAKASIEALPQKPNVNFCSVGVTCGSFVQPLQDMGNGAESASATGLKEEFLEAANEGSQEKLQDLQQMGVDSINIPPSCPIDSLSSLSSDYVHMENSMAEFGCELGNYTADPSIAVRSAEYLMLQEENVLSLPPFSRPYYDSTPSSCIGQVELNTSDFQKDVSSNHKFSSRTGNHLQVCSVTKLFQSRNLCSALSSSVDLPSWRVESAQEPVFHDSTKSCNPMQFPTGK